ncbi:MAG: iron ABC transporter permease [Sulfolobales archaeon]
MRSSSECDKLFNMLLKFFILLILTFILFFILILYGPVYIEPLRILSDFIWRNSLTDSEKIIIYSRRIPVALGALASGCLLGLSGFLYQLLLRNPMGDPYVMGVASISYLSLVSLAYISIAIGSFFIYMSLLAPIVVLISSLIYTVILSIISYRLTVLQLLLVGISLGFASSGISLLLLSRLPPDVSGYLYLALMGSFDGVDPNGSRILMVSTAISLILSLMLSLKHLDPLILGEEYAKSLGINIGFIRAFISLLAGSSAAITVAYVGVIGFIGFASPHIARIIFRSGRSLILVPASCLVGGLLALLTSLGIRAVFQGGSVPVTAVTSIFGAPLLIYMVARLRGEYSW